MKISEARLIEELQEQMKSAHFKLMKAHEAKINQNSFGVGYASGFLECSQDILKLILEGED